VHTYAHTYTCTPTHAHARACTRMHAHARTRGTPCACARARKHARTHLVIVVVKEDVRCSGRLGVPRVRALVQFALDGAVIEAAAHDCVP
jgi:hypothetical protein